MSEHVVAARFQYDDAGLVAGMQRDAALTRELNAAIKEGGPAIAQLAESIRTLGDRERSEAEAATVAARAKTAQTNATTAQSRAAAAASNASSAAARATIAEANAATAGAEATARLAIAEQQLERETANAAKAQVQLQETLRRNTAASEESAAGISSIEGKLSSATSAVKAFFAAWVVREAVNVVEQINMQGVSFNAELEQSRLSSAAIFTTFANIYDSQGKLLKGAEAFNAAQKIGGDLTEQIKNKTLQTTLLFSQMNDATRRSLAYEIQYLTDAKGVVASNQDLAKFTASFAQGAVSFGLAPEEIPNNLRGLLTGTADPRHARFAAALLSSFGTKEQAREQMAAWHDQGVLIQELQKLLEGFAIAGEKSMNTYTGAVSNLHDAWQQLVGEATANETGVLTKGVLELRDALVTVDKQGHATFNPELLTTIKAIADTLAKGATFTVTIIKKVVEPGGAMDTIDLFGEEMQSSIGDPVRAFFANASARARSLLNSATDIPGSGISRNGDGHDKRLTYGFLQGGSQNDPLAIAGKYWWEKAFGEGGSLLPDSPFTHASGNPGDSAVPFWAQPIANKYSQPIGPDPHFKVVSKKQPGEEEDTGAANKLADFRRWMETFHVGAEGTDGDPLAKTLEKLAVEQKQAIDHYNKAHGGLADANENWKKDLDDINATFANQRTDAIDKYNTSFSEALQKLENTFARPVAGDDAEAKAINDKLTHLQEIDALMRKFPDKVKSPEGQVKFGREFGLLDPQTGKPLDLGSDLAPATGPGSLALAAEDEANKKIEDARDKSLEKIGQKTIDAERKTAELRKQIDIDTTSEAERQSIELIANSIDRELATRIAANDKWAAEEDKRVEKELHDAGLLGLLKDRQDAIEAARQAKNKLAGDEAQRQHNAEMAGTNEWLDNLEKRRDEVIPKIGLTLQDTVIGALQVTQSAIDKFFADVAAGNANLGHSADALVHDLGQKWSKVFADALSAPLHGGSVLDSLKQIKGAFETGSSLDKFLAGAGIGSMVGGTFGPNNKAAAGGAIGGGIGSIGGGIIGGIFGGPGGAIIGSEIGTAIGSIIGSFIGSTMSTDNWIKIALHGVTLDGLRGPSTAVNNGGQITDPLPGGGSLTFGEKGLGDTLGTDIETQVRRKVTEAMKGYQSILDLFPDEVKAQLAKFHPSIDITDSIDNVGKHLDINGAMSSLSDFLSNKLPKAAFSAYEPALVAGLQAMGEGQNRIAELMTYWGTMQGTELHDAVMAYVTALVAFAGNRSKLGDPLSAFNEAQKNQQATPLSQLQDQNSQMALVVASLPKLNDVSDQLAAMQQLNSMSDSFFSGLVAAFRKIDDLQKGTNSSLDQFNEQISLAGMNDQQKLDYYYKQMGFFENQLQVTKDPQQVADLVAKIEQYGQAALGLAPDNAQNRTELQKISDEVRRLAGVDYGKAQQDLQQVQKSAFELLNTAANTLLKASNDLIGRGPGSGRGAQPGSGSGTGGSPKPDDPLNPDPNPPPADAITPTTLSDAFRTAIDDKPIAIATDNGVAVIVEAVNRVAAALGSGPAGGDASVPVFADANWQDSYRTLYESIVNSVQMVDNPTPTAPSTAGGDTAAVVAAIKALQDETRLLRTAVENQTLTITGDGAAFLRAVGFEFQNGTINTLRLHPELLTNPWD